MPVSNLWPSLPGDSSINEAPSVRIFFLYVCLSNDGTHKRIILVMRSDFMHSKRRGKASFELFHHWCYSLLGDLELPPNPAQSDLRCLQKTQYISSLMQKLALFLCIFLAELKWSPNDFQCAASQRHCETLESVQTLWSVESHEKEVADGLSGFVRSLFPSRRHCAACQSTTVSR